MTSDLHGSNVFIYIDQISLYLSFFLHVFLGQIFSILYQALSSPDTNRSHEFNVSLFGWRKTEDVGEHGPWAVPGDTSTKRTTNRIQTPIEHADHYTFGNHDRLVGKTAGT